MYLCAPRALFFWAVPPKHYTLATLVNVPLLPRLRSSVVGESTSMLASIIEQSRTFLQFLTTGGGANEFLRIKRLEYLTTEMLTALHPYFG